MHKGKKEWTLEGWFYVRKCVKGKRMNLVPEPISHDDRTAERQNYSELERWKGPEGESDFLPGSPSRSHWQEVPGDGGAQGSGSL